MSILYHGYIKLYRSFASIIFPLCCYCTITFFEYFGVIFSVENPVNVLPEISLFQWAQFTVWGQKSSCGQICYIRKALAHLNPLEQIFYKTWINVNDKKLHLMWGKDLRVISPGSYNGQYVCMRPWNSPQDLLSNAENKSVYSAGD